MLRSIGFALSCVAIVCAGCGGSGPKLYPVSGVVKVDGTPKSKLIVTFSPTKGGLQGMGTTNEKGEYIISTNGKKGALEGEHRISIVTINDPVAPPKVDSNAPSGGDAYMNQANIRPQEFKIPKEPIPAKYNKNSELVRLIEPGSNSFDFEVDTKAK